MIDAITIPNMIALRIDFLCFKGFMSFNGILDIESVSIMTRITIVKFERTSAFKTAPGKAPEKFVMSATTIAKSIINALLFNRTFAVIFIGL